MLAKRGVWIDQINYDESVIVELAIGSAMILLMCPGLAYLYSGLARRKSALHMVFIVFAALLMSIFQWYFWGFSLAFSTTASNGFIGNLHNFGYQNMENSLTGGNTNTGDYPEMAFANFQGLFASVTICILVGCIAERGRVLPCIIIMFLWLTLVYCPVACWVWNASGWAFKWGVLDYAGGGPVEILSGFSAFVYCWFLGQRKHHLMVNFRPHNVSMITVGTTLLWFGWLGFNGFTCLIPSLKTVYAIMNSNLCAAFGGFSWCLLDFRISRKWTTVGLCSGIISGLVAATPSSGCIPLWASCILGVVSGVVCNYSTKIKVLLKVDDSLDILAEHGIAGVVGLLFNALFGSSTVLGYDGYTEHSGGWIDHNWKQLYIQIAYIAAVIGYSCTVTAIICGVVNIIPGLQLRADEVAEEMGMDEAQIGEFAYDYVEVRRNFFDMSNFDDVIDATDKDHNNNEKSQPHLKEQEEGEVEAESDTFDNNVEMKNVVSHDVEAKNSNDNTIV